MAVHSVNETLLMVQEGINFLELQKEQLFRAGSLTKTALGDTFFDQPKAVMHSYLCVLDSIIDKAVQLNAASIHLLEKRAKNI